MYVEMPKWFDFDQYKVSGMVFKGNQMSIQEGIHKYGDDVRESIMKKNITSDECFGETNYKSLIISNWYNLKTLCQNTSNTSPLYYTCM